MIVANLYIFLTKSRKMIRQYSTSAKQATNGYKDQTSTLQYLTLKTVWFGSNLLYTRRHTWQEEPAASIS